MSYDYGDGALWRRHHGYDAEIDPNAIEDVTFQWATELAGDTIATSTFTLPDGLTQVSVTQVGTATRIRLSGASCGYAYRVQNRITTTNGRAFVKTQYLKGRDL